MVIKDKKDKKVRYILVFIEIMNKDSLKKGTL